MTGIKGLDPTGERAAATEAMETTPISGKEHEYRADGDHHPRQDAAVEDSRADATGSAVPTHDAAPKAEVETERHISKGIPGGGELRGTDSASDGDESRRPPA